MGHRPVVMQLVAGTRHISVTGMAHFILVSIILAVVTGEQAAGMLAKVTVCCKGAVVRRSERHTVN